MYRLVLVLLVCQNALGSVDPRWRYPLVETSIGVIRGVPSDDGQYSSFLGIPYAVVDSDNPFSESSPSPKFEGIFDADDISIRCPQLSRGSTVGQLQCLNLNVFVPSTANSQNLLPVMVRIHGGAFVLGSSRTYSPQSLIAHDVIYVNFNYRLGIYGFMCTDSPKAPGNVGLKDQLIALRWVNENIEAFGGDKNKITVLGESAGAMSVHLHLLSSYEKLFDQAIMQSGVASSPFTIVERDNSVPIRIAAILGLETDDVEEAIDFISKTDVDSAIEAGAQLESISPLYPSEPLTKPCVEKEFEGIRRFVEVHANDAIPEKAKTTKVIVGYCSQEMILSHGNNDAEYYEKYDFKELLQYGYNVSDFDARAENVRHFYIGDEATSMDNAIEITNFASDFVFNHPTERSIKAMVDVGPAAVYHYVFSYTRDGTNLTLGGVVHTAEMSYLFSNGETNAADKLTADRVQTMWTNFAKYGDPTPEVTELLPVKWEPVTRDSVPYMSIDKELTVPRRPFHARMAYWDIFYELNKKRTLWYQGDD